MSSRASLNLATESYDKVYLSNLSDGKNPGMCEQEGLGTFI